MELIDRVERLAFNALPAALTGDMWTHVYVQQANSVFAGKTKPGACLRCGAAQSGKLGRPSGEDLTLTLTLTLTLIELGRPSGEDQGANYYGVSHFPCCITNFPQGWPKFAMHAILEAPNQLRTNRNPTETTGLPFLPESRDPQAGSEAPSPDRRTPATAQQW